jgi:serine/threonine protein kinase
MPWQINQLITSNDDVTYVIEESLDKKVYLFEDRNSPSTLYKARDLHTGVTVFIKCYDENLSTRSDYIRDYKKIIDTQHNILLKAKKERDDLGIFKIIDKFTYDYPCADNERPKESICFVLEYHEGQTLGQKVKEAKVFQNYLNFKDVLQYAEQISSVLDYFHRKELALGLIVPSNIWITSSNEVFIINFDITWDIRNHAGESFLAERTNFCPISRKTGAADTKSDIYSLGAVLYYALTGIEKTYLIPEDLRPQKGLPPFSEYRNDIPKYVEDAIFKSIDVNSNKRFVIIDEFREALGILDKDQSSPLPDSEEIVRQLINQVQSDVKKVFKKAEDLKVEKSPLEPRFVPRFITDMIEIVKYVDPTYSTHFSSPTYSAKSQSDKKAVKRLPFYYYFYFSFAAFSIVFLPSLFVIPAQFSKNLPFWGFILNTMFMTLSTVWFSRTRLIGGFIVWLFFTCWIISIANYWNIVVIFAIVMIITVLFRTFKESFKDTYSSFNKAISDLEKKRSGHLSWDICIACTLGVFATWILASIFGRAG